ncbi:MAG: hypothetical protein WCF35_05785, partial [Pseudolabrys sp.]
IMGIGPVPAIHKLLAKIGRRLDQFDRIEINEAFAAQVLACTRSLGLADDAEHVNGNGGAIALGHPLGASGARLVMTAVYALRRQQQARALVSLCVGVGQGVALALERARPSRGYFIGTLIGGARSSEPDYPSGVAEPALSLSQEFRTPAT